MFYQPFEQYQYQQEQEQQRRELEIYKQQLFQQVLLSTPPPSPMATALGHPNRSCASCKKRKVKCDRKTPSCTACQKSKHRCHYTSYSPPVELQQQDDDEFKAIRQKIEQFQRMLSSDIKIQPTMVAKDGYANNPSAFYNLEDDDNALLHMNLATNPMMQATQFALPQGSPQHVSQQSSPQQLSPQPIQISAQPYLLQHPNSTDTSFIQTHLSQESCSPYMRGTITLNYNLNGMKPLLGRNMLPYLERMTAGQGPILPSTGFIDLVHLQTWLREKFSCQEWEESQDERFELRPIFEDVSPQQISVRQRFEVILHRVEFASSPISVQEDFQGYDFEDKPNMDMENYTTYSETGSNRSSIAEIDSTDVFLNKIYAFVRRFIRNHPWLRENFLMNLRAQSLIPMGFDTFNDGVFSDVSVEVRKIYSYTPYQDLKIIPNNHEELVKGRLLL